MSIVRTTKAVCDQLGCLAVAELSSQTTQPYLDVVKVGWKVGTDGQSLTCPADHTAPEHHAEEFIDSEGWPWLFNAHDDVWICLHPDDVSPENRAAELAPGGGDGGIYLGYAGGREAIIAKHGLQA